MCVRVRVCVRACVRACVCVCVMGSVLFEACPSKREMRGLDFFLLVGSEALIHNYSQEGGGWGRGAHPV